MFLLCILKQVGENRAPNLNSLTAGQTVAVATASDSTLRLYVNDVDHGVVARDVSLSHCHAIVDLYGRCDKVSVDDDCASSSAVSDYQEKAAMENGNCSTVQYFLSESV